jgi:hypothetical protein
MSSWSLLDALLPKIAPMLPKSGVCARRTAFTALF